MDALDRAILRYLQEEWVRAYRAEMFATLEKITRPPLTQKELKEIADRLRKYREEHQNE